MTAQWERSQKSDNRKAIEACLQAAGPGGLTRSDICRLSGVELHAATKICSALVGCHSAHSSGPTGENRRYVWTDGTTPKPTAAHAPVRGGTVSGHYVPHELAPNSDRPGSQDAFALPSVVGGVRVPRTPPASMGTGPDANAGRGPSVQRRFAV